MAFQTASDGNMGQLEIKDSNKDVPHERHFDNSSKYKPLPASTRVQRSYRIPNSSLFLSHSRVLLRSLRSEEMRRIGHLGRTARVLSQSEGGISCTLECFPSAPEPCYEAVGLFGVFERLSVLLVVVWYIYMRVCVCVFVCLCVCAITIIRCIVCVRGTLLFFKNS